MSTAQRIRGGAFVVVTLGFVACDDETRGAVMADASPALDAGAVPDAAPTPDAGAVPDAAPIPDAASTPDAAPTPDASPAPDAAPIPDASPALDAGARPPASGQQVIDACLGQTGVDERCTLVTNASACEDSKCSKLVVVFSGGEMGCVSGAGYNDVLAGYAARGYAAVCINYFDSSDGSAVAPYIDEAARVDLAVREATTGAWARAYWTGEDLLLEGISHGATAPVILMARTDLDDQPHWQGRRLTAGCFFDGSYDQAATASLLATGARGGRPCTVPVSHARWLERYCGPGATAGTCDLANEPKAQQDTITGILPANFAVRDMRMFECGSALPACSGDIIAGEPIQALCERIDASPTRTCAFESLPMDSHLTCHAQHYDKCRAWFEALPPR